MTARGAASATAPGSAAGEADDVVWIRGADSGPATLALIGG
ncbi:hypothetical protein [Sinosporangium album]|nr:hypothetical protein [Sinosporangium album]